MPTALSRPIPWQELDEKSPAQQKKFLAKYKDRFKWEPVSSTLQNITRGDHLMCNGSTNFLLSYEHHLLCTEVKYSDERRCFVVEVIEYTGGPSTNPYAYLRSVCSDFTGFGKIMINTYTYEELQKKQVKKEIWPEELERFDVEEVIRRAKSRLGESWYDALKNNCEHFVRWCKYGLNVSLQVESWYTWARQCFYSLAAGAKNCAMQAAQLGLESFLASVLANVSDEMAVLLIKKYVAAVLGFGFGCLLEIGICYYEIKKALKKRKQGLIESDERLRDKIVGIVLKGVLRTGLGIAGSVVGGVIGGIPGSFIGGAIGGLVGHLIGFAITWCYENRQLFLDAHTKSLPD